MQFESDKKVNMQTDDAHSAQADALPQDVENCEAFAVEQTPSETSPQGPCAPRSDDFEGGADVDLAAAEHTKEDKVARFGKAVNVLLIGAIAVLLVLLCLKMFVFTSVAVSGGSMEPTYLPQGETVLVNQLATPKRSDVVVTFKYDVDSKIKAYFATQAEAMPGGKYFKIIKRVVAIGGDEVWFEKISDQEYAFVVRVDGKKYYEFYCWESEQTEPFAQRDKGKYVLAQSMDEAKSKYGKYVEQITQTVNDTDWLKEYDENNPYVVPSDCFLGFGDNRAISEDSRSNSLRAIPYARLLGVVI